MYEYSEFPLTLPKHKASSIFLEWLFSRQSGKTKLLTSHHSIFFFLNTNNSDFEDFEFQSNICYMFKYRPFHKTLPRSSAFVNWISVRFYETGCTKNILKETIQRFSFGHSLIQKNRARKIYAELHFGKVKWNSLYFSFSRQYFVYEIK